MESAMSTAVKITRVEDIRPGDHVTLTCNDTTVSGTVRDVTHGDATHIDIANLPCVLIVGRSEEHTSELQSRENLVCRLLLENKNSRRHCCLLELKHSPE